jgi:23S rRNA (uracil1939-C5)-methyltransferase
MGDGVALEARFSRLVYGGYALGRLNDGRAAFVPYVLPGERARIRLAESRPGYVRGELAELLEPSPQRITPRCRHFTSCGGCHYQHLEVNRQREAKEAVLREQLARLGGLADPPLGETVASPEAWNYRNHLQFHLTAEGRLGFKTFRSERVIAIEECHLPEPELNALWPALDPSAFGPILGQEAGGARRVILRQGTSGPPVVWARSARGRPPSGQPLEFALPGGRFRVSPGSFFQVNTPLAGSLAGRVTAILRQALAARGPQATVLDLYCGVGLFSLYAAPFAGRVVGVELSPSACADYRCNLRKCPNAELVRGRVEEVLPSLNLRPEAVIADPPRAGLGRKVVQALAALRPPLLLYVSCDPATLARDARELIHSGYTLGSVTLLDLFPQTYHLESLSVWMPAGLPRV